jgi:hypothetical protein
VNNGLGRALAPISRDAPRPLLSLLPFLPFPPSHLDIGVGVRVVEGVAFEGATFDVGCDAGPRGVVCNVGVSTEATSGQVLQPDVRTLAL